MKPSAGDGTAAVYEIVTAVEPTGPVSGDTEKPSPRLPNPGVVEVQGVEDVMVIVWETAQYVDE
jgi:hypothetical protein